MPFVWLCSVLLTPCFLCQYHFLFTATLSGT